jgi:hypothetical protein
MLADQVDHIIGVDTHRDHHTLAVVDIDGGAGASAEIATDAFGYRRMLAFARAHAPARRVWAIEGTGSFGAGLTSYLLENDEWVVEIGRPRRAARRNGAKTDDLDAVRAAREALSREDLAQPRRRGDREAMRMLLATRHGTMTARTKAICQLRAVIVGAPEQLRQHFRGLSTDQQLERCSRCARCPATTSNTAPRSGHCGPAPVRRGQNHPRDQTLRETGHRPANLSPTRMRHDRRGHAEPGSIGEPGAEPALRPIRAHIGQPVGDDQSKLEPFKRRQRPAELLPGQRTAIDDHPVRAAIGLPVQTPRNLIIYQLPALTTDSGFQIAPADLLFGARPHRRNQ